MVVQSREKYDSVSLDRQRVLVDVSFSKPTHLSQLQLERLLWNKVILGNRFAFVRLRTRCVLGGKQFDVGHGKDTDCTLMFTFEPVVIDTPSDRECIAFLK